MSREQGSRLRDATARESRLPSMHGRWATWKRNEEAA